MPLKLAVVGRQRSLASLAKALYALGDNPDHQARAEAALVRANPHLGGDGKPRAGSTLVVPGVPGLATSPTARRAPLAPDPFDKLDRERLERLAKVAERLPDITDEESKSDRALLRDRTFLAALGATHPELQGRLGEIAQTLQADAGAMSLRAKQFAEGVKRALEDRDRLNARFGPGGLD